MLMDTSHDRLIEALEAESFIEVSYVFVNKETMVRG